MRTLLIVITLIALLASCRSTRTISKAVTKKDSVIAPAPVTTGRSDTQQLIRHTLQAMQQNHIDFNTFSAKVAIDYKGTDGKEYDVNGSVKMYKDSAIWISVNAILGIEAMRLLVTKDSVKLLNKLEKVYLARSVNFLQEVTSLPLDLYSLQNLVIGNPIYVDSNIIRYNAGNGLITLLSLGEHFKNLITLNEADKSITQSKLDDAGKTQNRTANLFYSDYEIKKGVLFSTKRYINVSEKGKLEIKLDFKNYNFNEEVAFPFSIPKNYKKG